MYLTISCFNYRYSVETIHARRKYCSLCCIIFLLDLFLKKIPIILRVYTFSFIMTWVIMSIQLTSRWDSNIKDFYVHLHKSVIRLFRASYGKSETLKTFTSSFYFHVSTFKEEYSFIIRLLICGYHAKDN